MDSHSSNPPMSPRPLYEGQIENGAERESQLNESMEVIQALMGPPKFGSRKPETIGELLKNRPQKDKRLQI